MVERGKKEFKEHWKNREGFRPRIIITMNTDTVQQWRTEGGFGRGLKPPLLRNSEVLTKLSRIPSPVENTSAIRIWVSPICKLSGTPD
jgi:hypothetical protein